MELGQDDGDTDFGLMTSGFEIADCPALLEDEPDNVSSFTHKEPAHVVLTRGSNMAHRFRPSNGEESPCHLDREMEVLQDLSGDESGVEHVCSIFALDLIHF